MSPAQNPALMGPRLPAEDSDSENGSAMDVECATTSDNVNSEGQSCETDSEDAQSDGSGSYYELHNDPPRLPTISLQDKDASGYRQNRPSSNYVIFDAKLWEIPVAHELIIIDEQDHWYGPEEGDLSESTSDLYVRLLFAHAEDSQDRDVGILIAHVLGDWELTPWYTLLVELHEAMSATEKPPQDRMVVMKKAIYVLQDVVYWVKKDQERVERGDVTYLEEIIAMASKNLAILVDLHECYTDDEGAKRLWQEADVFDDPERPSRRCRPVARLV